MNDRSSPRSATITYAFLSLVVRLISAQSGVFTLWYSRRAYERSRGEMITMLYEKTLNRKILGAKQEPKKERDADGAVNGEADANGNGHQNGQAEGTTASGKQGLKASASRIWNLFRPAFFGKPKAKVQDEKPAASMGKILNLMR
jgi:hypothetical protein